MRSSRIDTKKWSQRMRDPAWQFAGVVVAIVALLISVLVAYDVVKRTTENAQLEGVITRKYAFAYWDARNQDIEVFYLGQRARSVSSFFFTLQNIGTKAVRPEDYYSGPIVISVDGPGQIAKVEIIERRPETIDLSVTQVLTNTFQLSQALLNPGDQVEFQVILVNEERPWSEAILTHRSGRIVDGRDIRFRQENEPTMLAFAGYDLVFSFFEMLILAIVAALLYSFVLDLIRRNRPDEWTGPHMVTKIVVTAAMSVITVFWLNRLVNAVVVGHEEGYWQTWAIPAVLGGVLVAGYAIWIVQIMRTGSKKQIRQEIDPDGPDLIEYDHNPNDKRE